jgi:hypothetical protein
MSRYCKLFLLMFIGFTASTNLFAKMLAEPGSVQMVTVMNALANPQAQDATASAIRINYYDGSGNNPPCWVEYNVNFHANPVVAGAGGRNACGIGTTWPQAIVKVDIFSLKTNNGRKIFNDVIGYEINPGKFYTTLLIEEDVAPVFTPDGKLETPGTIKVTKVTETLKGKKV